MTRIALALWLLLTQALGPFMHGHIGDEPGQGVHAHVLAGVAASEASASHSAPDLGDFVIGIDKGVRQVRVQVDDLDSALPATAPACPQCRRIVAYAAPIAPLAHAGTALFTPHAPRAPPAV